MCSCLLCFDVVWLDVGMKGVSDCFFFLFGVWCVCYELVCC